MGGYQIDIRNHRALQDSRVMTRVSVGLLEYVSYWSDWTQRRVIETTEEFVADGMPPLLAALTAANLHVMYTPTSRPM